MIAASFVGKGISLDKPSEMMAFSLSLSALEWLHQSVFLTILKIIHETLFYCINSLPNDWFGSKVPLYCRQVSKY